MLSKDSYRRLRHTSWLTRVFIRSFLSIKYLGTYKIHPQAQRAIPFVPKPTMFDHSLRALKDTIFNPLSRTIPPSITPTHITFLAFLSGLVSCIFAIFQSTIPSLFFWALNRFLDCLDGAVARHRKTQSDVGGFLDLLGDFVVYALIPISCALGNSYGNTAAAEGLAVAVLEATFWINNFVLFYCAAVAEKWRADGAETGSGELTSVMMRPALVEGFESAVFFTLMLMFPCYLRLLSWVMGVGVGIGTVQRVLWIVCAMGMKEQRKMQ